MLSVKWRGVEDMLHDLKVWNSRAIPYAARNALNTMAFEARGQWQGELKRSFTLRNQFTVSSIRVDKATGLDTRRMVAVVGTLADYLEKQEKGGTVRGKTGKKAIPGPVAAGQAPGTHRTRVVRAGNRMSRLQIRRIRHTNKRQFNAIAIALAKRTGSKAAVLHRPRGGKGVFAIRGSARNPTTALLFDVSRGSVTIRPTPTLSRTLVRINARAPRIWYDAVLSELKRHRIAGY